MLIQRTVVVVALLASSALGVLNKREGSYGPPPRPAPQRAPHREYGVPQQIPYREYGPPSLKYGPPKFISGGGGGNGGGGGGGGGGLLEQIKTHFGVPRPHYGPPHIQHKPAPQYGPPRPRPSYGPPQPQPLPSSQPAPLFKPHRAPSTSYGPPPSGPLNLGPRPAYGPPQAQYGPPPLPLNVAGPPNRVPETTIILSNGGNQGHGGGPVKQVQIQIDAAGHTHSVSGSQAPFHTACDGWKPIPAPVGAYVEHNHIDTQSGYSQVAQGVGTQYHAGAQGPAAGGGLLEGLTDEQLVAVALQSGGFEGAAGGANLNSIETDVVQHSAHAIGDSYSRPPPDSFAPGSVHAQRYNTIGGGLTPPSGSYGPPPQPPQPHPHIHSQQAQAQAQAAAQAGLGLQYGTQSGNALPFPPAAGAPPSRPVAFRPPVPQGLLESIGQTVQHLDQFGVRPPVQPPTYIPPATNEIAGSGPGNLGPEYGPPPPQQEFGNAAPEYGPPPAPPSAEYGPPPAPPSAEYGPPPPPPAAQYGPPPPPPSAQYGPPPAPPSAEYGPPPQLVVEQQLPQPQGQQLFVQVRPPQPLPSFQPQPQSQPHPQQHQHQLQLQQHYHQQHQQQQQALTFTHSQGQQQQQQQHQEFSQYGPPPQQQYLPPPPSGPGNFQQQQQFTSSGSGSLDSSFTAATQQQQFVHAQALPLQQEPRFAQPHDCSHGPNFVSSGYQFQQQQQQQQQQHQQQQQQFINAAASLGGYNAIEQSIPLAETHTEYVSGQDSYSAPASGNAFGDHEGYASQKNGITTLPDGTDPLALPGLDGLNVISAEKSHSIQINPNRRPSQKFQLQIGNSGNHPSAEQMANHDEILSQGLLQTILSAIEEPQPKPQQQQQQQQQPKREPALFDPRHGAQSRADTELADDATPSEDTDEPGLAESSRVEVQMPAPAPAERSVLRVIVPEEVDDADADADADADGDGDADGGAGEEATH